MNKPLWIFVSGSYRTGSTTHYEMTRDVVIETGAGVAIGYHNERRLLDFDGLDWGDMRAISEVYAKHEIECPFEEPPTFSRDPFYIVCKVFEYLPGGFRDGTSHGQILHRQNRVGGVLSVRDPRDIITSMRKRDEQRSDDGRKKDGPFDYHKTATVEMPTWLGWSIKWADLGPERVLVSKFEQFTRNLYREVRRIAAHLDLELEADQAKGIAKRYRVNNLRKRKKTYWKKRQDDPDLREDPALPSIPALVFASSGQWQEQLTEEEAILVYEANQQYIKRFGYGR